MAASPHCVILFELKKIRDGGPSEEDVLLVRCTSGGGLLRQPASSAIGPCALDLVPDAGLLLKAEGYAGVTVRFRESGIRTDVVKHPCAS